MLRGHGGTMTGSAPSLHAGGGKAELHLPVRDVSSSSSLSSGPEWRAVFMTSHKTLTNWPKATIKGIS